MPKADRLKRKRVMQRVRRANPEVRQQEQIANTERRGVARTQPDVRLQEQILILRGEVWHKRIQK